MAGHKQVPIKVNAFCDEGIAELVPDLLAGPAGRRQRGTLPLAEVGRYLCPAVFTTPQKCSAREQAQMFRKALMMQLSSSSPAPGSRDEG